MLYHVIFEKVSTRPVFKSRTIANFSLGISENPFSKRLQTGGLCILGEQGVNRGANMCVKAVDFFMPISGYRQNKERSGVLVASTAL